MKPLKDEILRCLDQNVNMPTNDIVTKLNVSSRYVQAVRKAYKEALYKAKKGEVVTTNKDDVFDTGFEPDIEVNDETIATDNAANLNILSDSDIEILNIANEGGWSIQQLAENSCYTLETIKKTLSRFSHMVKADVLDESDPEVFFKGSTTDDTQAILDELDAIPGVDAGIKVVTRKQEDFWEIEQDCVTACSKVDKSIDVFMNIKSRRKAMLYMKWAGAREWLAYLVGKFENGKYIIEDLYLPDQRTSSALVDKVDTSEFNKIPIVGVIHSHHEMGAGDADRPSFSGHDAAFINSNHNLSLLAGRDGTGFKIVGIVRTKTPCGSFIQIKAAVKALNETSNEDKALKDEFLEKTQTQPQAYAASYVDDDWQNGYFCGNVYPQNVHKGGAGGKKGVVVNDKRTYHADSDGIVRTRGKGFHFTN